MRKVVTVFSFLLLATLGLTGCDLLDSQNVQNPQLTEDQGLSNPNPLQRWMAGMDRQMAITLNNTVIWTSIATDNYVNTQTFFNQAVDGLDFNNQQQDIDDAFFTMNDLRESAIFGKNTVVPRDDNPSPRNLAELDFYEGMSHILLGEHFHSAPLEGSGEPADPADHFQVAIDTLQQAIDSGNGDQVGYMLAQARAYYNNGNLSEARSRAEDVLNEDPDYVRLREFDNANGPANNMQDALYDRQSFDDFQPLPRLDFLDPKFGQSGPVETPFPILKAEEAHLILIEAALAENDLPGAQEEMKELITLVQDTREARTVDETNEGRTQESPGSRPDTSSVEVRASPNDPFRSGLVIDRTANTEVAAISNTSVTDAMVDDVSNAQEAWELYYLLRQEIFMAEGRRFATFGIKAPVPFNEAQINENIAPGSPPTQPIVPDYITSAIQADGVTLDSFSYDEENGEATIDVNMNRVLANNRNQVSPFL
jgi:tetratricopeptide (TPR) repeat protein